MSKDCTVRPIAMPTWRVTTQNAVDSLRSPAGQCAICPYAFSQCKTYLAMSVQKAKVCYAS